MKAAMKRKWIRALRSGKFKQGRNNLCQIDGEGKEAFCCLGVLAKLQGKDDKWLAEHHDDTHPDGTSTINKKDWPKEWPSLADTEKLVNMNDGAFGSGEGKSFKAIASYLERRKNI